MQGTRSDSGYYLCRRREGGILSRSYYTTTEGCRLECFFNVNSYVLLRAPEHSGCLWTIVRFLQLIVITISGGGGSGTLGMGTWN